ARMIEVHFTDQREGKSFHDHALSVEPSELRALVDAAPRILASLGDGKLGLLVAQVIKTAGSELLLVGRSPEKLALARSWSIPTALADELTKEPADIVVDCTGSTRGFETALGLVKPRGTIVVKTTVAERFSINLAPLVINEITVVGSRCGPFEPALKALADGSVQVKEMISKTYPMEQALEAFELASRPETLKVLIRM
ncbi:MAG: zinc-binding dehydrogenase, partial [Candidatus Abyssubacteria bacterium]|nr:zinc-binding dehydrogenase [Candidatus Abyssubacteria bacterium]